MTLGAVLFRIRSIRNATHGYGRLNPKVAFLAPCDNLAHLLPMAGLFLVRRMEISFADVI